MLDDATRVGILPFTKQLPVTRISVSEPRHAQTLIFSAASRREFNQRPGPGRVINGTNTCHDERIHHMHTNVSELNIL
jgi:hypothetical protein